MNPQDFNPAQPPAAPTFKSPLGNINPGEELVCEIKRHPIGIMAMYIGAGMVIVLLAVLIFFVAPDLLSGYNKGQVLRTGSLVFGLISLLAIGIAYIAHRVYWGNRWVVTSESIIQVKQISLFYKQTSQLSLGNLEDITAEQNGLLAEMFHFGVISAETAAATDKFTFIYCPNPTYYAQQILAARERFEARRRQEAPTPSQPMAPVAHLAAATLARSIDDAGQSIGQEQQ